ncbi:MAG: NAD-dependent epimerase/dehydratase family protein [Ginsengibacter sp.]
MYTILGAGGAIANEFSKVLFQNKTPFTLVSRSPRSVYGGLTLAADLTSKKQTDEVLRGASVVLLCPGLKYDIDIWNKHWPLIMSNTIEACSKYNLKLIFFDNVYMLGEVNGAMTEQTAYKPVSKKGELREKIATQLMDEVKAGNITAMIARAADFYGPNCKTSILNMLVLDKMAKRKKAQWFINDNVVHSFTFTPDCGKALWLLSNSQEAWNQIWNLPTASPALTGKEIINIASQIFGMSPKHTVIGKGMVGFLGVFMKIMKELKEMLYQYEADYIFDSSKFEKAFGFTPTTYKDGIQEVANSYQKGYKD